MNAGYMDRGAGMASIVTLPASCTLREAHEVRRVLLASLEGAGPVKIHIGAVTKVDTSVLQLLACFVRDLREGGRRFSWRGEAGEFDRAVRQLGLQELLGRAC
jgi:anti-anti-sigma regulatory factor